MKVRSLTIGAGAAFAAVTIPIMLPLTGGGWSTSSSFGGALK